MLKCLGFLWLLPATVLFWLVYMPLAWRNLRFVGWLSFGIAHFEVLDRDSWYSKKWRSWYGFSGPCCIITRSNLSWVRLRRTVIHERRHCMQQLLFGPLFYPLYGLCSAALWVYGTATDADVHAYFDNPFEVDARVAAGQRRRIPRTDWPRGRDDRLPWW